MIGLGIFGNVRGQDVKKDSCGEYISKIMLQVKDNNHDKRADEYILWYRDLRVCKQEEKVNYVLIEMKRLIYKDKNYDGKMDLFNKSSILENEFPIFENSEVNSDLKDKHENLLIKLKKYSPENGGTYLFNPDSNSIIKDIGFYYRGQYLDNLSGIF